MSRHNVYPFIATHDVVTGWDRPLNTFFAQVLDAADEESEEHTVLCKTACPCLTEVARPTLCG